MYKGFNPDLERAHQDGTEWKLGAASAPSIYQIPLPLRQAYLPVGEVQRSLDDTEDCASRAPNNILAPEFTYAYKNGLFKAENKKWLEDNGYVGPDGKIDFSDRFVAIKSGTTVNGNSLKAPLDAINNCGLIPKLMLPLLPNMTVEQYLDPAGITQAMTDLGEEFARRFIINYEQVPNSQFADQLKSSFIDVALFAWPGAINGIYPRTPGPFNHAVALFELPPFFIFDNYEEKPGDFIKQLAPDYLFFDYGYRVFVSKELTPGEFPIPLAVYDDLEQRGLLSYFIAWLTDFFKTKQGAAGISWWMSIFEALMAALTPKAPPGVPETSQSPVPPMAALEAPKAIPAPPSPPPALDFSTPSKAYHSTRIICDDIGLSYVKNIQVTLNGIPLGLFSQKDILCACVYQESHFLTNPRPNQNRDPKTGEVWSTDYGIVQVNDYYNIGPGKPFASISEVLTNAEKCIRWMAGIYKSTNALQPWASYTTGAYKQWLKANSPLWRF